jgi:hypothetical protein
VLAVRAGGSPVVNSGSSTANSGMRSIEASDTFAPASTSDKTANWVTSLPVPAVVGMAMIGSGFTWTLPGPTSWDTGTPAVAAAAAAFAASMALPPPNPMTPSCDRSTMSAAALSTTVVAGSGSTSAKTPCTTPAAARTLLTCPGNGVASSPRSVTMRGWVTPTSARRAGSWARAPSP